MKHLNLAFAGVVAGSLALSAQAGTTEWWAEDFSGYSLDITQMTNRLVKAGIWATQEGDTSSLAGSYSNDCATAIAPTVPSDVLVLNTEGNELTFTPTNATTSADFTVVDADVFFVGSDTEPNLSDDTTVQFALFLKVPEDTGANGVSNSVMVYVNPDQEAAAWVALPNTNIGDKTWHHVQVKIKYDTDEGAYAHVFIDGTEKTPTGGYMIANGARTLTTISSVSFKGTGAVDNFAGSFADETKQTYTFTAAAYVDGVLNTSVEIDGSGAENIEVGEEAEFFVPRTFNNKPITNIVVKAQTGTDDVYAVADNGTTFTVTPDSLSCTPGTTSVSITIDTTDAATTGPALVVYYGDYTPPPAPTAFQKYFPEAQGSGTSSDPYQIPNLAALKALQAAVASNDVECIGAYYVQTANIDMSSAGAFAGIGTYNANPTAGTPFTGTYDGGNFKITNVDFTQRNYGGVFNQVNGGTIKNLTVSNITCSAFSASVNEGEWGGAIVGNAGNGAKLQNLVAEGTFGTAAIPATHNVAGIVIRACAGGTGTLIKDCTNNATLYGAYTKIGGICAITQYKIAGGVVTFDGCVNNGDIISSRTTTGVTGYAGILGYNDDDSVLVNCSNTGSIVNNSGANTDKDGALVGWAYTKDPSTVRSLTDQGGNSAAKTDRMLAFRSTDANVTGFQYATVANDIATTISGNPVAGGTYLLEGNAAPVIALAVGESVAFDTALGYTLDNAGITAGTGAVLSSSTSGTVTTYTAMAAVAQIGTTNYATLADAVAAARAGDTVKLLGNVTLDARVEPTVSMTIDLGGNTITRTGTSGNGSAFDVKSGTVVITNGVIDCTQDDTAIVADGVYAITSRSGSNVTLAALTITVDSECGACAYPFSGSTMTIESGTYANVTTTPYRYNTAITGMAVNQPNNATQSLIIKGGSFSQYDPQLGDDSGQMTDFTGDGFVAIADGNGHFVVQPGFNVTFDADGGTPAPEAQRIVAGGSAAKPATDPTKEGFTFDGWTLAGSAYDFTGEVVADITLVAAWTENTQPVEPPQVDPGTGVADYNTTYGTAVAPIEVTSSAFKVNFVATVPGIYVLMAATTVDGTYAETEVTQTVTAAQIGTENALVTLEDTNTTAPAKFYKIGWEE